MPTAAQSPSPIPRLLPVRTKSEPGSPHLSSARYGKDNVRILKVNRDSDTGTETVTEITVCCLLEGDIATSYTEADNSVVVATDSIKNTAYILAKQHAVTPPELFASILGQHFISRYKHIHIANVKIITHRWLRMIIDGKPHPHSFVKDAGETRNVEVRVSRHDGISIVSVIDGLSVLKSTGSAFHGFLRDEFTTLPDTWDRILCTNVNASWTWHSFSDLQAVRKSVPSFDEAWEAVRQITLKLFAEDASASVQNTMYKMCEQALNAVPGINKIAYSLPNNHNFEIDLRWHNGVQDDDTNNQVYAPQASPNGLIHCEVSRHP